MVRVTIKVITGKTLRVRVSIPDRYYDYYQPGNRAVHAKQRNRRQGYKLEEQKGNQHAQDKISPGHPGKIKLDNRPSCLPVIYHFVSSLNSKPGALGLLKLMRFNR